MLKWLIIGRRFMRSYYGDAQPVVVAWTAHWSWYFGTSRLGWRDVAPPPLREEIIGGSIICYL